MEVNPKEHVKAITLRSENVLAQDKVVREEKLTPTYIVNKNSEHEKEAGDVQSQSSAAQPKSRLDS